MEAARFAPVDPVTGAYTTTYPASSIPTAGTAHAQVGSPPVLTNKSSNNFTVT
jgi:hypothetical protein